MNTVELLAKLGVNAEVDDQARLLMTMKQYDKLRHVISAKFVTIIPELNRVVVEVDETELQAAVDARKTVSRGSVNVQVSTRTIYDIESDGVNEVTELVWHGGEGHILVNGREYAIETGLAADHYNVGEDADPERTVYFTTLQVDSGEEIVCKSYSLRKLIDRVCAVRETIV